MEEQSVQDDNAGKIRWHWQYLIFSLTLIFSVDGSLIPLFRGLGIQGWRLFWLILPIGEIEVIIWFFFWRWFLKDGAREIFYRQIEKDEDFQEGISLGVEIKEQLEESGLLDKALGSIYKIYSRIMAKVNKIKKSHSFMLFLGWEPFVAGGRMAGVIFCASKNWRAGLCTLLFGNIFHIAYMIGLWTLILSFIDLKLLLFLITVVVILVIIKRKFKSKKGS